MFLKSFDAISPWTVGAYRDVNDADEFAKHVIAKDTKRIDEYNMANGKEKKYIPVVFPGWSAHNSSNGECELNAIPRGSGEFLWRQVRNARQHGARTIFGATWDG